MSTYTYLTLYFFIGDPVLQGLIKVSSDNIGVRLLKSMGWKEGQGTGPRRSASKHYDNCKVYIFSMCYIGCIVY